MGCGPSRPFTTEKKFRRAIKLYEVREVAELTNVLNRNKCFESGDSPLTLAAKEGHEAVVEVLLQGGANVNMLDRNGKSPLHIAVQLNDAETVQVLLDNNASANKHDSYGVTPLHVACERGYIEMVKKLLESGAEMIQNDKCEPPLIYAVNHGHDDCVLELLKHSADPNVRDFRGTTALQIAVGNNYIATVKHLLNQGASVEKEKLEDENLVCLAVLNGSVEITQALLQKGCSPSNFSTEEVPPIIAAAGIGSADCLDIIINAGADVDTTDRRGQTPLQIAVMAVSDLEKRPYYSRYFSNVYRGYSKYDPCDITVEHYTKCAILLIECGADLSVVWQKFSQVFPHPMGLSYEETALCEFLVQAFGFNTLPRIKLKSFIRGLLTLREYGLVRLLCSVGITPDNEDIYASNLGMENLDLEFLRWVQTLRKQPRQLKDLCRIQARKSLSKNIVHALEGLELAIELKQYMCVLYPEHYSKVS